MYVDHVDVCKFLGDGEDLHELGDLSTAKHRSGTAGVGCGWQRCNVHVPCGAATCCNHLPPSALHGYAQMCKLCRYILAPSYFFLTVCGPQQTEIFWARLCKPWPVACGVYSEQLEFRQTWQFVKFFGWNLLELAQKILEALEVDRFLDAFATGCVISTFGSSSAAERHRGTWQRI